MHTLQLSIVIAVGLAWTAARAERTALLVSGTAPPHARELARSAMTAAVKAERSEVIATSFTQAEAETAKQCMASKPPWDCMKGLAKAKGIEQLVISSVDGGLSDTGEPTVQITTYLLAKTLGHALVDRRYCDPCTDASLASLAGELAQTQLRRLATLRGTTLISIHPTPRNARITLDREVQIAPDIALATYPGPHVIQLELEGHHSETRTFEAVEGTTVSVSVVLRPIAERRAEPAPVPPPPRSSRTLPIVVGALGASAIVAGAVLIAVHEPPASGPSHASESTYATRTPGIVTTIGGALALGTSIYLWRRQARSALVAAPMTRGAAIGWAASF